MGKTEIIDKLIDYSKALRKQITVKRIILYGSFARGTAEKDSDIDIAVVVEKLPVDFLKTSAILWKVAAEIDSRIEPILLDDKNDDSGFLESINKYGEEISLN